MLSTNYVHEATRRHSHMVRCVVALPDGTFVSASNDHTLKLWQRTTGDSVRTFEGHADMVLCVVSLPGRIASTSMDRTIKLWGLQDGQCHRTLIGHQGAVMCALALPDGLISASDDETLRRWDTTTGLCLMLMRPGYAIDCLALFSDGRVLLPGEDLNARTTLQVWDVAPGAGRCLQTWAADDVLVNCVAALPDGRVISGGWRMLKVWEVTNASCVLTLAGPHSQVLSVATLPNDTNRVVSSSDDGLKIWRLTDGACLQAFNGFLSHVHSVIVCFDGRIIAGSADTTIRIYVDKQREAEQRAVKELCRQRARCQDLAKVIAGFV